jgi:hypothetical protein
MKCDFDKGIKVSLGKSVEMMQFVVNGKIRMDNILIYKPTFHYSIIPWKQYKLGDIKKSLISTN